MAHRARSTVGITIRRYFLKTYTGRIIAGILTLAANSAFGGGVGSTGGGHAVVCRDPAGQVTSVELLDLYDARAGGVSLRTATGDIYQDYAIFLTHLRSTGGDYSPVTSVELDEMRDGIAAYFNFFPAGVILIDNPSPGMRGSQDV